MRVLGVDPSSSSGGHAVVDGDDLVEQWVWTPKRKVEKSGEVARMMDYYSSFNTWLGLRKSTLDMTVVEELGVMRGAKTARILAHFEAIACIICSKHGLPVVRVKAGVARNEVLGLNPNCTKEEVLVEVRRKYPDMKLPPVNRGGPDIADAFVLAKAGPIVISS